MIQLGRSAVSTCQYTALFQSARNLCKAEVSQAPDQTRESLVRLKQQQGRQQTEGPRMCATMSVRFLYMNNVTE